MELKDQILQTKERKKGFLNAMPESTRTQIDTYTKLDRISGKAWTVIVCGAVLALIGYLFACLAKDDSRWVVNLIPAALLIAVGVVAAICIRSIASKAKKAISLGAPDYVEELTAINARLVGLERAEKVRQEAEKQEAKAKARAEAAQRDAELALQRQQEVTQSASIVQNVPQPAPETVPVPPAPAETPVPPVSPEE
ncbi:MAG: hypothetical protein IJL62_05110 [Clostridia bacterium]|nr:hypothetical protein [Clostridia bacterium]